MCQHRGVYLVSTSPEVPFERLCLTPQTGMYSTPEFTSSRAVSSLSRKARHCGLPRSTYTCSTASASQKNGKVYGKLFRFLKPSRKGHIVSYEFTGVTRDSESYKSWSLRNRVLSVVYEPSVTTVHKCQEFSLSQKSSNALADSPQRVRRPQTDCRRRRRSPEHPCAANVRVYRFHDAPALKEVTAADAIAVASTSKPPLLMRGATSSAA